MYVICGLVSAGVGALLFPIKDGDEEEYDKKEKTNEEEKTSEEGRV